MRVTFNSLHENSVRNVQTAAGQLAEAQRQVSSGKRISRPSDDPSAAAGSLASRAELATVSRYEQAADSVYSRLTVIDTVLSDVVSKLTQAETAAMSARGSSKSQAQREAAAQELDGIRSALLDDFNAAFNGVYLFAGTRSTTRPYNQQANGSVDPYAGSTTEMQVDVNRQTAVTVVYDGSRITQGGAAQDVFAVIDDLMTAARNGDDDALGNGMAAIRAAFDRATAAQSRVGAGMVAIDGERTRLGEMHRAAQSQISKFEDANMAEAISSMNHADTAYRAALGAVSTANKVSLLDYLG